MSNKRAATSDINHENWDKEDPKDREEMGTFNPAPREVLEKRVIRTARRRTTQASNDEKKKSVFSGFGFNKTQPTSFDFLANLTKPGDKNDNPSPAPVFNSPALTGGSFGDPASPKQNSTLFQMPPNTESASSNLFGNKSISGSMFSSTVSTSNKTNFETPSGVSASFFTKPTTSANVTPSGLFSSKANSSSMFGTPLSTTNNVVNFVAPPSTVSSLFTKPTNGEVTKTSGLFSSPFNSGTSSTTSLFTKPSNEEGTPSTGLFNTKPTNMFNTVMSTSNTVQPSSTHNTSALFTKQTDGKNTTTSGVFSNKVMPTNMFSSAASTTTNTVHSETTPKTTALFQMSSANNTNAKSVFSTAGSSDASSVFKPTGNSNQKADPPKRPNQESSIFGCSVKRFRESERSVKSTSTDVFKETVKCTNGTQDNPKKVCAYHNRLKELNIAVLKWITKHVNESPSCILSPVFGDYNQYIRKIREKYDPTFGCYVGDPKNEYTCNTTRKNIKLNDAISVTQKSQPSFSFGVKNTTSSAGTSSSLASSIFGEKAKPPTSKPQTFTFGIQTTSAGTAVKPTISIEEPTSTTDKSSKNQTESSAVTVKSSETKTQETGNVGPPKFSFGITNTTTSAGTAGGTFSFTNKSSMSPSSKVEPLGIKSVTSTPSTFSFANKTTSDSTNISGQFGTGKEATADTTSAVTPLNNDNPGSVKISSLTPVTSSDEKVTSENVTPINQISKSSPFSTNMSSASPFSAFSSKSPFSTTSTPSTGFTFGSTNTLSTTTPFSFGDGKPFTFNSSVQQKSENTENTEENDEPPKVEYNPVVEKNSVYEKKCKIFIKKDDNYVDNGVGTLYIKKVDDNEKHQLLVRANTNLGTILMNLLLSSAIPCQRIGKNNVMLVCIPLPDSKPPPTPVLIRVKTSDEADQLLETLNKYKA